MFSRILGDSCSVWEPSSATKPLRLAWTECQPLNIQLDSKYFRRFIRNTTYDAVTFPAMVASSSNVSCFGVDLVHATNRLLSTESKPSHLVLIALEVSYEKQPNYCKLYQRFCVSVEVEDRGKCPFPSMFLGKGADLWARVGWARVAGVRSYHTEDAACT